MIAWSDVVVIAPELAPVIPTGSQAVFIADAYAQMNPGVWGGYLDIGAKYLTAHLATMSTKRGQAGPSKEKHVDKIGQTNDTVPGALNSTEYGMEYLRLLNLLPSARGPQPAYTPDLGPGYNNWLG